MESMTGYAFLEKSTEQFSFSIEIKSLNSRYLEVFTNLPKILRNDENDLHAIIKKQFSRGKIELTIDIFDWTETKPISLNHELIEKYYKELKKLHKKLEVKDDLDFESILSLEGISQRERSSISSKSKKDIYDALSIVVKKAHDMRNREGVSVKKDLLKSVQEISSHIAVIKKLSKDIAKKKSDQLKKKISALVGSKIDDVRLYTEISILADKLDINEEIVRLVDHIKKFKEVIKNKDQVGRKLDFLAQEMFREINTISSKSNSSEISHIVVDLKNYIDRIREQCRNIV